jgi:PAS domain S-box-containing protein
MGNNFLKNIFSGFQLDRNQVLVIFLIPVVILVSVNVVSYMNSQDLHEDHDGIILTMKYFESIETLRDYVNDAHTSRQMYFISDGVESLEAYRKSASSVDSQYAKVKVLASDNNIQKQYLDTLSTLIRQRFDAFNRGIEIQKKKGNNIKFHKTLIDEGAVIQNKINQLIFRMKNEENLLLRQKMELEKSKSKFTIIIMVAGTFVSVALLVIIFIMLASKAGDSMDNDKHHKLTADELETIVRERTAEISKINTRLYKVIGEHEKTMEALMQSEKDLYDLFEQAHDAIIIFTPGGKKVLDVNNRACAIYGITKENFKNLSLTAIFKNIPENEENIKKTLEKGYYYNFQTVHYRKDGTEMLMEINASVINYKGQTAILSINRDITERILALIPLPGS